MLLTVYKLYESRGIKILIEIMAISAVHRRPLSLVLNKKAGLHFYREQWFEQILAYWRQQGFTVEVFELSDQQPFTQVMSQVLTRHDATEQGVVVAAGGDGTVNAVAQALLHSSIPLAVLPMGTFNYVARVLNIPLDLMQAAKVIATGQPKSIHVAQINDYIYLNNASLGLYPLFIKRRELYNSKLGRLPINAYLSGLDVLIRDRRELKLEVTVDQQKFQFKTPLVFFGNNHLQLSELKLNIAKCAKLGKVAAVIVSKSDKLTLFKTLFRLVKGDVEQSPDVYMFGADQIQINLARYKPQQQLTVAIDGEIVKMTAPLNISVKKHALNMMVPYADSSV